MTNRRQEYSEDFNDPIWFHLRHLTIALNDLARHNPLTTSINEKLSLYHNLELFGLLTPEVLHENFPKLKETDKTRVAKAVAGILEHHLRIPGDFGYKKAREKLLNKPEAQEIMKFMAFNIAVGSRQMIGTNYFLEVTAHNNFIKQCFFEGTVSFSFSKLNSKLKAFANYHQRKSRETGAAEEFKEWIKGKEERIKKHKTEGRGWKKMVYNWTQQDGISVGKTLIYKYLKNNF